MCYSLNLCVRVINYIIHNNIVLYELKLILLISISKRLILFEIFILKFSIDVRRDASFTARSEPPMNCYSNYCNNLDTFKF